MSPFYVLPSPTVFSCISRVDLLSSEFPKCSFPEFFVDNRLGAGDETLRFWNVFPSPKYQAGVDAIEVWKQRSQDLVDIFLLTTLVPPDADVSRAC
ncbi:hypothetical protein IEQ34_019510 [Dendrobium chrysotoxum]|uniref:Uncharacterized protein n=1 Tax=Dendrobium chrysotoxum TaxID=161865 RepID=A0AAV7G7J8_DENCH|nr:hypothetical protein IEQ34_019510 [Dendrobium chrysotoxum]